MLVLNQVIISKKSIASLSKKQKGSVIDVVNDIINMGLLKPLQRFITFCGDIRQNIHHIIYFMKFYVDKKDVRSQNVSQVTDMPNIRNMPLKYTKDMTQEELYAATELCNSYRASSQPSSLKSAEGRFLHAESPVLAAAVLTGSTDVIIISLLKLIGTFAGITAFAIAIIIAVAATVHTLQHITQRNQPDKPLPLTVKNAPN